MIPIFDYFLHVKAAPIRGIPFVFRHAPYLPNQDRAVLSESSGNQGFLNSTLNGDLTRLKYHQARLNQTNTPLPNGMRRHQCVG
jgi:hypothetical protein